MSLRKVGAMMIGHEIWAFSSPNFDQWKVIPGPWLDLSGSFLRVFVNSGPQLPCQLQGVKETNHKHFEATCHFLSGSTTF